MHGVIVSSMPLKKQRARFDKRRLPMNFDYVLGFPLHSLYKEKAVIFDGFFFNDIKNMKKLLCLE